MGSVTAVAKAPAAHLAAAVAAGPDWRKVHSVADAAVAPLAGDLQRLLGQLAAGLDPMDVERLIRTKGLSGVLPALDLDGLFDVGPLLQLGQVGKADPLAGPVSERVLRIMVLAQRNAGLTAGAFQQTNPQAVAVARAQVAALVRGVARETRAAIRAIITASVQGRYTVRQSAVLIRHSIGLTARQARALANYHQALLVAQAGGARGPALQYHQVARPPGAAADDAAALARAAARRVGGADRRYAVRAGMSDQQVERMVASYGHRALRWRSWSIARTETMRAANRGLSTGWRLAADRGMISPASRRVWVTTPDERLCSVCAPMGGRTVGLTEDFVSTERGLPGQPLLPASELTTSEPPIHPMCRCTLYIDILEFAPALPAGPL